MTLAALRKLESDPDTDPDTCADRNFFRYFNAHEVFSNKSGATMT